MNPRSIFAIGVGGIAAAVALAFGACKQIGVKSYGTPAGRVVRAGQHLCVLMETRDPYFPSLKGVAEREMSYSYSLWMIPEKGDRVARTITLSRGVASNARTHNIGVQRLESGVLWLTIDEPRGIDVVTGRPVADPPPTSLVNAPISQLLGFNEHPLEPLRAQGVTLASGDHLYLASSDEIGTDLKPGTRLYGNPSAKGTYKARALHTITVQPGPIPRVAAAAQLGDREFRNGAFMRKERDGEVVTFANPEGFLVVHDAGDPVHPTVHLSRVNADGTIAWTADTGIGRLTQVLPHETLPAFVGEPPQQLAERLLAVVNLDDGTVKNTSLKGPSN